MLGINIKVCSRNNYGHFCLVINQLQCLIIHPTQKPATRGLFLVFRASLPGYAYISQDQLVYVSGKIQNNVVIYIRSGISH